MALSGDFNSVGTFDDTKIAYASWGTGPTLILVNGIACSDAYWTYLVPHIVAAGYRVVFYDHRGHGRSGPPANPNEISTPSFARDLWSVADAAGVRDAVLLGHSYGSQIMLEAYRLQPTRVRGLVSVAGPFEHPLNGISMVTIAKYILALMDAVEPSPWATRAFWRLAGREVGLLTFIGKATRMAGRNAPDEIMAEYFTSLSRMDPMVLFAFAQGMQQHSARDLLPDVKAPCLILSGANDVMTPPRVQREMAALMPDGRLEVFEDSGHTFPVDEIDRFNARVHQFLDGVFGGDESRDDGHPGMSAARPEGARKAQKIFSPASTTEWSPDGKRGANTAAAPSTQADEDAADPSASP